MGTINDFHIIRYVIIPLAGFLVGAVSFILIYKKSTDACLERLESQSQAHQLRIIYTAVSIFALYYIATIVLKYYGHHMGAFDFGIYDHRIWQIHIITWANWIEKFRSSSMGHFYPILVFYSILYDLGIEPVMISLLQVCAVLSGLVPLYLIAKTKLKSNVLILFVGILFLIYPATQFNIAFDFHPDHLIIPILFWCYYFIEKEKYISLGPLIAIGYMIKEPFILSFAFLGIYIAWDKKRYLYGITLFFMSVLLFYVVVFVIMPEYSNFSTDQSVQGATAFGYLFSNEGIYRIYKEITSFEKWRFPVFLLLPMLFLPIGRIKEFLPAVPLLLIPMLSTVTHHQSVSSHYTAGIIPPLFISLVSALDYLDDRCNKRVVIGLIGWMIILTISFNIAHSPSPLAIAFWNKDWSHGNWHYTNYIASNHETILKEAIKQIPTEPTLKVVVHSRIYDKNISHRHFFNIFPERISEADYVLLDNSRGSYVLDTIDPNVYRDELEILKADRNFKQVYNMDGVLLFKRRSK